MTRSPHPQKLSRYVVVLLSAVPSRNPAGPSGPVLSLRAATRTHHDRIDRLIDLRRLVDRAYYARVLQVFDAFLAGWEARVLAALPQRRQTWLRQRSRRGFLQQDLRVLGVAPCAAATELPALATAAADGELAEPESLEQACRAAGATFDALSHLLERSLHERGHA